MDWLLGPQALTRWPVRWFHLISGGRRRLLRFSGRTKEKAPHSHGARVAPRANCPVARLRLLPTLEPVAGTNKLTRRAEQAHGRVADALVNRELGPGEHLCRVFGCDEVRVLVLRAVRHQH